MHRVVHFEIHAKDKDALQAFYQGLFGWEFQTWGTDPDAYRVIATGPGMEQMMKGVPADQLGINGGMTSREGAPAAPGAPVNAFVNIISVEDTDAVMQKAVELGGKVALDAVDMPKVGRVGYLLDPENNLFGVLAPDMSSMAGS